MPATKNAARSTELMTTFSIDSLLRCDMIVHCLFHYVQIFTVDDVASSQTPPAPTGAGAG